MLLRSLFQAALTATLALVICFPVALWLVSLRSRLRYALLFMAMMPFFANAIVRVYAWILLLRADGAVNNLLLAIGLIDEPLQMIYTNGAVYVALIYQFLPYMLVPLFVTLERLDWRQVEASFDLGAGQLRTFGLIVLPGCSGGIIAGFGLVFIASLGNYIAPTLMGGAKSLEVGTLLAQSFLSARDWPFGAAIATVLAGIAILFMLLPRTLRRKATT